MTTNFLKPEDFAVGLARPEDVPAYRWQQGDPKNSRYYYDEALPRERPTKGSATGWPPENMDLSDAWVVLIVEGGLSQVQRYNKWPVVFSSKGLQAGYTHKGQAAKGFNDVDGLYHYKIIFGTRNMIGREGAQVTLPTVDTTKKATGGGRIELGLVCQVQSATYSVQEAHSVSVKARERFLRRKKHPEEDEADVQETKTSSIFGPGQGPEKVGVLTRSAAHAAESPEGDVAIAPIALRTEITKTSTKRSRNGDTEANIAKRVKPGHLIDLVSSDESEKGNEEKKNADMIDILQNVMDVHSKLVKEHAALTKACRLIAKLDPGANEKTREAMQTIQTMSTRKRTTTIIEVNNSIVNVVHEKGYGRIFEPSQQASLKSES